jgi:hypothetical protein
VCLCVCECVYLSFVPSSHCFCIGAFSESSDVFSKKKKVCCAYCLNSLDDCAFVCFCEKVERNEKHKIT